jgi:hypothetical protein
MTMRPPVVSTPESALRLGCSVACGRRTVSWGWLIVEDGAVRLEVLRVFRLFVPPVIHGVPPFTIRYARQRPTPTRWGLLLTGEEAFATVLLNADRYRRLTEALTRFEIPFSVEETRFDVGLNDGYAGRRKGLGPQP